MSLVKKYTFINDDDLPGYVKELYGLKTGKKPNGVPYNHTQEVDDALRGLKNGIDKLEGYIKNLDKNSNDYKSAVGVLNEVKKQYNGITNFLNQAQKAASKFSDVKNF